MTKHNDRTPADVSSDLPPHDELDALLRRWHTVNATRAAAGRDQLMARLASESAAAQPHAQPEPVRSATHAPAPLFRRFDVSTFRRFISPAFARLAASLAILAVLAVWLVPGPRGASFAQNGGVVLAPEAGRLDAFDAEGNLLGPCPLKHTDVNVDISAFFSRVTVRQTYANTSQQKVEAVYTFPLSHRGAVDRMTMSITPPDGNERVVVGEVKERELARQIYESAREQGYVASLLEQERPNIFTQSVANIEPGANVVVEISYVETLESRDGEYHFEFPMVVGPRYIPGYPQAGGAGGDLPRAIKPRPGLILLGPATMVIGQAGDVATLGTLQGGKLETLLNNARPIAMPGADWWIQAVAGQREGEQPSPIHANVVKVSRDGQVLADIDAGSERGLRAGMIGAINIGTTFIAKIRLTEVRAVSATGVVTIEDQLAPAAPAQFVDFYFPKREAEQPGPTLWHAFEALYCDGSKELGTIHTDGTGQLNGRWFFIDPRKIEQVLRAPAPGIGTGYEPDTNQVPDASRISPMPVKPPTRAGHDISLKVNIDTGGPAILDVSSELHQIKDTLGPRYKNLGNRASYALSNDGEIPNRDFMLSWRTNADSIQEAQFAHTDPRGNFFTLILAPPARVDEAAVRGRELVFVMDTSGSMSGLPIEKSKAVINKAIDTMRDRDTFNIITFAGATAVLWDRPRPATAENRASAQAFISGRQGSGGTEMMKAIEAALVQQPVAARALGGVAGADRRALTPLELANLPADGREVTVAMKARDLIPLLQDGAAPGVVDIKVRDGLALRAQIEKWTLHESFDADSDQPVVIRGEWSTKDGQRLLRKGDALYARDASDALAKAAPPMRICVFLTDGYVGNDMAIIDAVRHNAATTRVFSFGIGNSVNRYLLDSMARAGRGKVEYVSLEGDADAAVQRLVSRIEKPVLTDIQLAFGPGIEVTDTIPPLDAVPDLFDVQPLIIHGRYTRIPAAAPGAAAGEAPARTTLTIRGRTGAGAYERTLDVEFPRQQNDHDVIATLWARAKAESLMNQDLASAQQGNIAEPIRKAIIALGEQFGIVTQFTSFVAVEKSRMTIGGKPMLVAVPIELPAGTAWEGFFGGEGVNDAVAGNALSGAFKPDAQQSELASLTVVEVVQRISQAQTKLSAIESDLVQTAAKLEGTTAPSPEDLDRAAKSPVIARCDADIAALKSELNHARDMYPGGHPAVADLQSRLGGIEKTREAELNSMVSQNFKAQLDGLEHERQEVVDVIAKMDSEYEARNNMLTDTASSNSTHMESRSVLRELMVRSGSGSAGMSPRDSYWDGDPGRLHELERQRADALRNVGNIGGTPVLREVAGAPGLRDASSRDPSTQQDGFRLRVSGLPSDGVRERNPGQLGFGVAVGTDSGFLGDIPQIQGLFGQRPGGSRPPVYVEKFGILAEGTSTGAPRGRTDDPRHAYKAPASSSAGAGTWESYCMTPQALFAGGSQYGNPVDLPSLRQQILAHREHGLNSLDDPRYREPGAPMAPAAAALLQQLEAAKRRVSKVQSDLVETAQKLEAQAPRPPAEEQALAAHLKAADDERQRLMEQMSKLDAAYDDSCQAFDDAIINGQSIESANAAAANVAAPFIEPQLSPVQAIVLIADLVNAGRIDDAKKLAAALSTTWPSFDLGVQARDALNDVALDEVQRKAKVNALVDTLRERIGAAMARAHLQQVLDERLIATLKEALTEKPAVEAPTASEAGKDSMQLADGRAMVTVLVEKVNDETKRALTGAGMRVEDASAKPPLVVGWVNPRDLGAVAFVEGVRRIEPTK